jgi:branched-chain amino acid transport system permease protein
MKRLSGFLIFAALCLVLPVMFPDNYYVTVVGLTIFVNITLAVSLNLLMGYAGQISLGHAAFFGLGAYSSAVLTIKYGMNPWLAMAAGALIVLALSYVLSRPILKLKGHYLAMATLGLGIIVHILFVQADNLTGGPDCISGLPTLSLFGLTIDSDIKWYWVLCTYMLLSVLFSLNIADSRAGRALSAVHGSEIAAQMMGIDTAKVKSHIFVFSALMASIAGSLFAHQQDFVSPESFSFFFSIELVTMVVLGGLGSTFGAVIGAFILSILPEVLIVFEDFEVLIFGAILMVIMIFLPEGLFVALKNKTAMILSKRQGGA